MLTKIIALPLTLALEVVWTIMDADSNVARHLSNTAEQMGIPAEEFAKMISESGC